MVTSGNDDIKRFDMKVASNARLIIDSNRLKTSGRGQVKAAKYAMERGLFDERRPAAIRSRPLAVEVMRPRRLMNQVRTVRSIMGITQKELAAKAGIHRKTLSDVEWGRSVPSVGLALVLAEALQVKVGALFSLETPLEMKRSMRFRSQL